MTQELVRASSVTVIRGDIEVLSNVELTILPGEHWVIMGGNGAGKSTLLSLLAGRMRPSHGTLDLLGHRVGRIDLRLLRSKISATSSTLVEVLSPNISVLQAVVTGINGDLSPVWHHYSEEEFLRARTLLRLAGIEYLYERALSTLSAGERQKALMCRMLMPKPRLALLDEPSAGLDLGAREDMLAGLGALMKSSDGPEASVTVTHHVEELPDFTTHLALLRHGHLIAVGRISETLSAENLSKTFDRSIDLISVSGRFFAFARPPSTT